MFKAPIRAGVITSHAIPQLSEKFRDWAKSSGIHNPGLGTLNGTPVCIIFDSELDQATYLLTWEQDPVGFGVVTDVGMYYAPYVPLMVSGVK